MFKQAILVAALVCVCTLALVSAELDQNMQQQQQQQQRWRLDARQGSESDRDSSALSEPRRRLLDEQRNEDNDCDDSDEAEDRSLPASFEPRPVWAQPERANDSDSSRPRQLLNGAQQQQQQLRHGAARLQFSQLQDQDDSIRSGPRRRLLNEQQLRSSQRPEVPLKRRNDEEDDSVDDAELEDASSLANNKRQSSANGDENRLQRSSFLGRPIERQANESDNVGPQRGQLGTGQQRLQSRPDIDFGGFF